MKRYVRRLSVLFALCAFLYGVPAHAFNVIRTSENVSGLYGEGQQTYQQISQYGNPLIGDWRLQTHQYWEVISFGQNWFRVVRGDNGGSWPVWEGHYQTYGSTIMLNGEQGQFATNGYQLQISMSNGRGGVYQRVR